MKHLVILIVCLFSQFQVLIAQNSTDELLSYSEKVYPPEFSIRFKNSDDQKSFKSLREFLKEKQALLENLKDQLQTLKNVDEFGDATEPDTSRNDTYRSQIEQLNRLIKNQTNDDAKVKAPYLLVNPTLPITLRSRYRDSTSTITVGEVRNVIMEKQKAIDETTKKFDTYTKQKMMLEANIRNVSSDITRCTNQIDSALAPEYQQQNFRKTISISFSILIGLLLSIFFYIVYKRSDHTLSKDLLSGNGLQFITLFVLIIAVILFGILSILGSSELAAILSGISGYILGKGTQKDLSTILSAGTTNPAMGMNQPVVTPPPVSNNPILQPAT